MIALRIAPIVEGQGEVAAVPRLLERVWTELLKGDFVDVLRPVRCKRTKLLNLDREKGRSILNAEELTKAVRLAVAKLRDLQDDSIHPLVLLLLDADRDCPKYLAPELSRLLSEAARPVDTASVLANKEYETWFVAAAQSLSEYLRLEPNFSGIADPEERGCGKKWIADRYVRGRYSETVDQVRLSAKMDIRRTQSLCPSFAKLCHELEKRLPGQSTL